MAIIPANEKVFMVDTRTNTVYGGSQALQDMQQWYTMQDVSDSVGGSILPYKVFTALLTQSGGDDPISITSGYPLTVGVSYTITDDGVGYVLGDFTNVGAPDNELGTTFIATGTTPNSWGVDIILIYNNGAPIATVLENTIGNVWFTYKNVGQYRLNSIALFTEGKTFMPNAISGGVTIFNKLINDNGSGLNSDKGYFISILDRNRIDTSTIEDIDTPSDYILFNTPIEIRVYN